MHINNIRILDRIPLTNLFLLISVLIVLGGCNDDFLDQVPDDRLTFDETFSKENTVEEYLANIYNRIPQETNQRFVTNGNSGPWTAASDEAEYTWSFVWSNNMNIGTWDATTSEVSSLWSNFYRGIRAASTFIQSIDQCEDCSDQRILQYTAEARTLRAYFYYNLIRTWGPVILMGEEPIDPDADLSGLQRATMDESVAYIVAELDKAASTLSGLEFRGANAGRMSRPFALAIKEKVLLLAASPLFNGNTDYADLMNSEGTHLINQTTDNDKWKLAADAAKAFIEEFVPTEFSLYTENNENGVFDPYLSTRNVMLKDWNSEIIYARTRASNYRQYEMTPYHNGYASEIKGGGALGATQEMVDSYFMANGRSIEDPTSGYQDTGFSNYKAPYDFQERETFNQWVNREPRFYTGITYNNSLWMVRNYGDAITETWYGGNSGKEVGGNDYSTTGYIVRKDMVVDTWSNSNRSFSMIRLAEIYLDYVEALNEYDPGNADILIYLNAIRTRAGIPGYGTMGLDVPADQASMREAIHKERKVELAFENVRYFDIRRWKVAQDILNGEIHGLDINTTDESEFYNVVPFETRVFTNKHYLWPIPQDEINTNTDLIQNTGW
ncbi:RagB/SusD family nutrient uptake outer membrane protein [Arenibacter sp. M-2]|uniref:RagB/SusD family nutrient uptake outer membrane protein n=1 Tax=Arenibacter sp. M-2 TaxID=3053612 RepID=UPI0025707C9C|nr:RagB/SusD family nutrient uptake outer membrane protein [Arenibacter sp. M-2]MDL5514397.1 RagB/SusD family nutrient uptake outer membrane protein [Arenibacter sp. M-2]